MDVSSDMPADAPGKTSQFEEWFARAAEIGPNKKQSIRRRNEQKILSAAEVQFAKEGFRGTTIGDIAKCADLPRANIMYYFESKEDIYRTVLYRMCLAWEGPANEFSIYSNPKEAMTTYIRAKMQLAREQPNGSKVWVSEVLRGAEIVDDYLREHLRGWLESRSNVVRHWIKLGLIEPVDPRTLFFSIWATTQHYADFSDQLCILNDDEPFSDEQFEIITTNITQLYLRGMGIS